MTTYQRKIFLAITIFLCATVSVAQKAKDKKTTSANKKIMLVVVEGLFNKGDTAIADKYFVTDFAKEEKEFTTLIRKAFPDLRIKVDMMVAENDQVAARWTATGTHRGFFMGVQPTGRSATWKGSWFWTFKNGKIVDGMGKGSWDALGLLQQLQSKN